VILTRGSDNKDLCFYKNKLALKRGVVRLYDGDYIKILNNTSQVNNAILIL